jgi:hypothetical protein
MAEAKVPTNTLHGRAAIVAAQSGGSIDADCEECCSMRLPKYRIFVRSFHPNPIFEETDNQAGWAAGGPWKGDNRGYSRSLSRGITSRVMHSYEADTAKMNDWFKIIKPHAESAPSHAVGANIVSKYPYNLQRYIDPVQTSPYGRLYELSGPQKHPDIEPVAKYPGGSLDILGNHAGPLDEQEPRLSTRTIPDAKIVRSELLLRDQRCRKAATVITHHFGVNLAVGTPVTSPGIPISRGRPIGEGVGIVPVTPVLPPFIPYHVVMGLPDAAAGHLVPDLDVFAKISFDLNRTKQTLDIETTVFGDGFPNCEAFLVDEAGTSVFLGVSTRIGSPFLALQSTRTNFMFKSKLKFALSQNGALLRFASGRSIEDWNNEIEKLNPNSKSNTTSFEG